MCIIRLTRQQVYKSRTAGWLVPSRPGPCGVQRAISAPWAPPPHSSCRLGTAPAACLLSSRRVEYIAVGHNWSDLAKATIALRRPTRSTRQNVSPGICPTSSKPVVGCTKCFEQLRTKMQHKHKVVIVLFPILFLQLATGSVWDEVQPRLPNWGGVT